MNKPGGCHVEHHGAGGIGRIPAAGDPPGFTASGDGAGNYAFVFAMFRLRALITAERWATEHDEFDLYDAAALARNDAR